MKKKNSRGAADSGPGARMTRSYQRDVKPMMRALRGLVEQIFHNFPEQGTLTELRALYEAVEMTSLRICANGLVCQWVKAACFDRSVVPRDLERGPTPNFPDPSKERAEWLFLNTFAPLFTKRSGEQSLHNWEELTAEISQMLLSCWLKRRAAELWELRLSVDEAVQRISGQLEESDPDSLDEAARRIRSVVKFVYLEKRGGHRSTRRTTHKRNKRPK